MEQDHTTRERREEEKRGRERNGEEESKKRQKIKKERQAVEVTTKRSIKSFEEPFSFGLEYFG